MSEEESTIEVRDLHTGDHQILGKGSHPTPSPYGNWIVCVLGHNEEKQLWLMDCHGKNLRQLSHVPGGLGAHRGFSFDFTWSPDARYIALSHQPYQPRWERKHPPQSTIALIDLSTHQLTQLGSFDSLIRYLSWLPNGEELLFVEERVGLFYQEEEDREWIRALQITDGSLRTLAEFDGLQQHLEPMASPDGGQIALMYDVENPLFSIMLSLCLISNQPASEKAVSPMTRLTEEIKVSLPCWSPGGERLYVRRIYGAYAQIYAIDVRTRELTQITQAPLHIENYALSPDGKHIAWTGKDAQATRKICVASSDGQEVKDLVRTPGVPNGMALSEVREVEWQGPSDYPIPMRGLLVMPLNYKEGTVYPLLVDIHGGGTGASLHLSGSTLDTTPLEWQMWAAKG